MTLREKILSPSKPFPLRKYLAFTPYILAEGLQQLEVELRLTGWSGTAVRPWQTFHHPANPDLVEVIGPVHRDGHFMKLINGYWVRTITVEDIFRQWGFQHDLILIDYPDLNRHIWEACAKFASHARMMVLPEDNHNEEVVAKAQRNRWTCTVCGDDNEWLVMEAP